MFKSKIITYNGHSQCAQPHSIPSYVKLFFGMNVQE